MTDVPCSSPPEPPSIQRPRLPWVAALLSLLMPGVGHAYCGRLARGLAIGVLYGLAIPAVLEVLASLGPASTVPFGFLMIAATVGVVVLAAVDAFRLARRTRPDYQLKAYNSPGIYLLLGLLIQGSNIGCALHVRSSLFEAFRVPAASEYPTIIPEDRILVNKIAYRQTAPRRGDTVLFKPPNEGWRGHYVKRVVAVGGDTVEIKEGFLYVNGEKLPCREIPSSDIDMTPLEANGQALAGRFFRETNGNREYTIFLAAVEDETVLTGPPVTVPAYHCFVLGDNRNYSHDSRQFGPIPYAAIAGRADYIYWPADKWCRFGALR